MSRLKPALVLIAAIAFVLSPIVSPGFSGFTADQFPIPQIDPPIQPIGITFAVIWTIIYAWLVAMGLFGLIRRPFHPDWEGHRTPLIVSLAIGAAWIPVANLSPIIATILIWAMLATALMALLRAPLEDRLWAQAPMGLYAGWLTAASCVATAVTVTGYGATPVQPIHAAFLLLAAVITLIVARREEGLPFYVAGVLWGIIGIFVDNIIAGRLAFAALVAVIGLLLAVVEIRCINRYRAIS